MNSCMAILNGISFVRRSQTGCNVFIYCPAFEGCGIGESAFPAFGCQLKRLSNLTSDPTAFPAAIARGPPTAFKSGEDFHLQRDGASQMSPATLPLLQKLQPFQQIKNLIIVDLNFAQHAKHFESRAICRTIGMNEKLCSPRSLWLKSDKVETIWLVL